MILASVCAQDVSKQLLTALNHITSTGRPLDLDRRKKWLNFGTDAYPECWLLCPYLVSVFRFFSSELHAGAFLQHFQVLAEV